MIKKTDSVDKFIAEIPQTHQKAMNTLRDIILQNLPEGFEESLQDDMITYQIPKSTYPRGEFENPESPLLFITLAIREEHILLDHKGFRVSPFLLQLFLSDLSKVDDDKPALGQNTIKFKINSEITNQIAEAVGKVCRKITLDEWIEIYEDKVRK